ncbi:MAG TPA: hypothetical protein VFM09_10295 [Marmoricola sp.]|nr:hypothetical protein [Marmoricola sp.]
MAILHRATLRPSKPELIATWLDREPWGGTGEVEVLASYRFDDPAGQVGVEAFLVGRGDRVLHLLLTYRDRPLESAESALVGTLEHSVLGTRWVYDGQHDPVARECFARALRGEQEQAVLEVWDGETLVATRESGVRLRVEPRPAEGEDGALQIVRDTADAVAGDVRLVADWGAGPVVVAACSPVDA